MPLSDLPTELIVHVFKSVDDISSASTLSQTSRYLHIIWRYNLTSIFDAVLPQMIECYDEADQFLEISATATSLASPPSTEDQAKAAIVRAKDLFTIARIAYDAQLLCTCGNWERRSELVGRRGYTGISSDQSDPIGPEPCSHTSFVRGFYRAMSMTYLAEKAGTKRYQTLASMNLLHFFQMVDIMDWIWQCYFDDATPLPYYDNMPSVPWAELRLRGLEKIEACLDFLQLLESELVGLPGLEQFFDRSDLTITQYQDCSRDMTEAAKGIALADLLPKLASNSSIHSNDRAPRRDR
ncbi:MAG: hypothetical protein ASARMPRED_007723 [Alectoria sarmentosa]|nr:MAG: hypothetical protein ASARMPRED_007723 [Alectoria sarmentosa]